MKRIPYARTLMAGVAALMLALVSAHALRDGAPPVEPTPAEAWLIDAGSAPEVELDEQARMPGEDEWDLPPAWNDRVAFWVDFLTGKNRERTRLWLERKGKYGPMIRTALRERGMPEDLLYLAMIESGLSPKAYSHAAASGMWQFISETGQRYGLEVSTYVDERRDPVEATGAALDYLQELHERFGSWYLAAAAYNTGENRVDRILRQRAGGARGDDDLFWKIDQHLPRETRDYVPLMLAMGHIAKDPAKYGFEGLEPQRPLAFETVEVPGATALDAVSRAAEVDAEAVRDLNPHLLRGATPPGRDWQVRIPVGHSERFAANFPKIKAEARLAVVQHTVRRGETLSHIARRYDTSVRALRAANGWIHPRRVRAGQRLEVPAAGSVHLASNTSDSSGQWTVYRVRRGDSLWTISRRYGVSVRQLQAWNDLGRRSRILPGQRLRIRA